MLIIERSVVNDLNTVSSERIIGCCLFLIPEPKHVQIVPLLEKGREQAHRVLRGKQKSSPVAVPSSALFSSPAVEPPAHQLWCQETATPNFSLMTLTVGLLVFYNRK